MARYSKSKRKEIETIQKLVSKFGKNIPISNEDIIGNISITHISNIKKHEFGPLRLSTNIADVKIEFDGLVKLRFVRSKPGWFDSSLKNENISSLIVINRQIKRGSVAEIRGFLKYFSIHLLNYKHIKKVVWVDK